MQIGREFVTPLGSAAVDHSHRGLAARFAEQNSPASSADFQKIL